MVNNDEISLKERIKNDMEFRIKCHSLGVKWDKFSIGERYGNESLTIALETPNKDVFILMDENYNVIGVHRFNNNEEIRSLYSAIYNAKSIYNYVYVLYDLTIRDIVELSNRINITQKNNSSELRMIVNGEDVNTDYGKLYIDLLSYIKFLGNKIEEYYKNLYKAKLLGLEYPSIVSYVTSIINNIDNSINESINENRRPWPVELLSHIGENNESFDYSYDALYKIIDLLLYEKGFKIGSGNDYLKLKPLDEPKEDLYKKSSDLLRLLDVSKEEVNKRFWNARNTYKFNEVNLEELLAHNEKKLT